MVFELSPLMLFIARVIIFAVFTILATRLHWLQNRATQQKKFEANNIPFDKKVFHEKEQTATSMDIIADVIIVMAYTIYAFAHPEKTSIAVAGLTCAIALTVGFFGSALIIKWLGVSQKWLNEKISKQSGQQIDNNPES